MAQYTVTKGHTWGVNKDPAGTIVEVDPEDAAGFVPWKLREVPGGVQEDGVIMNDLVGDPVDEDGDDVPWEGLSDRVIDILEAADIFPEDLSRMTDKEILDIDRVGPTFLKVIREAYPKE